MSSKFLPLRSYIFDRLYHPSQGYFCKPDFQVGELKAPINFTKLIGYDDYQKQLVEKYPHNAWLTPCEIFKPYYGMTIARYLKAAHQRYQQVRGKYKLRIVEAGAGTGSAAESILYFFSNFHRQMLPKIQYTIVEISPALCKKATQKLNKAYPQLIKNQQIKIINQDISDFKQAQPCFTLFFQVLDNLPHDKVIWNPEKKQFDQFVTVDPNNNTESFSPIQQDLLIKECLQFYLKSKKDQKTVSQPVLDRIAQFFVRRMASSSSKQSKDVFLPTYLLRLLKRLKKNVPQAHLVISDFDKLISSVPGINAPIVSCKGYKSAQRTDFNSYLIKRGQADIFFPVDFNLLKTIHNQIMGSPAQVVKSHEFISQFSQETWAQTRSSFNPIREDFGNTSFLVKQINKLTK